MDATQTLERKTITVNNDSVEPFFIELNTSLKNRADVILNSEGISLSDLVNTLLEKVVKENKIPNLSINLSKPPIPCIDDLTDEELEAELIKGIEEIEAGLGIPMEEVEKELTKKYGIKF